MLAIFLLVLFLAGTSGLFAYVLTSVEKTGLPVPEDKVFDRRL